MRFYHFFILLLLALPEFGHASEVKYKKGKDLSFEELLIEGQLKRPELGVITGDEDQLSNGLLRLREDFNDRMSAQAGQEVP